MPNRRPRRSASPPPAASLGPQTPHLFAPTAQRPVRAKAHRLSADTRVVAHHHPWGQLTFSASGVLRVTAGRTTCLVPPSRAVWIPPGLDHAITVVEDADMRTVYVWPGAHCAALGAPGVPGPAAPTGDADWQRCRVLEVSDLLRVLVLELDTRPDGGPPLPAAELERERLLSALVCDELRRAQPVRLGVDMPADKRLRALCEAVWAQPAGHDTLEDWARQVGASPRTLARLFRQELGSTFGQWRQQVLLAQALALAARRLPMAHIAAELGYASPSAFSAMVRRAVGMPPSRFFSTASGPGAAARPAGP